MLLTPDFPFGYVKTFGIFNFKKLFRMSPTTTCNVIFKTKIQCFTIGNDKIKMVKHFEIDLIGTKWNEDLNRL